ncbi:MAG: LysE family transporter [Rhodobacteraceae bacterium]|nr:LysE family transporter [Paracoccaceae bacterium]
MSALIAAWLAHLVAAASPGPAILLAARTGVTQGFATGFWLSAGLALGGLIWAVAALFGLAALFQFVPTLFWLFKLAGAGFLIWLAVQMWRHARDPMDMTAPAVAAPKSGWGAFRLGLLAQLANPKPAVFFGAVFAAAVPPGTALWAVALLLLGVFFNELLCTLGVARAFSFAAPRHAYQRFKHHIDRVFGGFLAGLGVKLATS